jgi:energy-coupling factor transport system substrate-specific component
LQKGLSKEKEMKKFGVRSVVASAILAALVFVLLRFVAIPTPFPDTTLSIYAAVVAFFAVVFGPAVGFVGGFLGNLLVDLTAGWGIWWTWVVVTGLYGLFVGLGCKGINLEDGVFGKKEFIRFTIVTVLGCLVCWGLVAPVGDILVYAEPANLVFIQGLFVGLSGMISSIIVGGILCRAYAASRAQKGSLTKEN